jgi:hypothetical protein
MDLMRPPPLPAAWPYPPRGPAAPEIRAGAELPGLEGAWTLSAAPGLALAGAPSGLGGAFGRGGVFRCGEAVLRPYRRGGLVRLVNARTYPGPERFRSEYEAHRALWEAGLPTVEPLGYAYRPHGWGVEGVYLTRFQEGAPWPRTWAREAVPEVRAILEALSAWGLLAPDLNATNFLLDPQGRVLALDWDRARWAPGDDLRARYRSRLERSLRKLGAPEEIVI